MLHTISQDMLLQQLLAYHFCIDPHQLKLVHPRENCQSGSVHRKLRVVQQDTFFECWYLDTTKSSRRKREVHMRLSPGLKVGIVSVFSCLALFLSLFASTGMASAHSTQMLQNQTSASMNVNDLSQARCRTFISRRVKFNGFARFDNGQFFSTGGNTVFFNGQRGFFLVVRHMRVFHKVVFRSFERITIVTICGKHRSQKTSISPM